MSYCTIVKIPAILFVLVFLSACEGESDNVDKCLNNDPRCNVTAEENPVIIEQEQGNSGGAQIEYLPKIEEIVVANQVYVIDDQFLSGGTRNLILSIFEPQVQQEVFNEHGCVALLAGQLFEVRINPENEETISEVWVTLEGDVELKFPWEGGSVGAVRRTTTLDFDGVIKEVNVKIGSHTYASWDC
jgi:nitrate reductase NapAB chaperone NapD